MLNHQELIRENTHLHMQLINYQIWFNLVIALLMCYVYWSERFVTQIIVAILISLGEPSIGLVCLVGFMMIQVAKKVVDFIMIR